MPPQTDVEQLIRQAAMKVFLEKGQIAASMKEIADEAGIKRTLLHYYFRSKEKLYELVFSQVMGQVRQRLGHINQSGLPIRERLDAFIDSYFDNAMNGDYCEAFFIHEYNQNPEHMNQMLRRDGYFAVVTDFIEEMNTAHARGELAYDARQLFLDLLALCMFPFAAPKMLGHTLGTTDAAYADLLVARKAHLKKLMKAALRP